MPISINFFCRVLTQLDPQLFTPLKTHIGKTGQIYFSDRKQSLYFRIKESALMIEESVTCPDMMLSGTTANLIQLLCTQHQQAPVALFSKYHIDFSGDISLLSALHQSFLQREIDWEGHLSTLTGPIPALMLSLLAQKTQKWAHTLTQARKRDLTLFLQEEQKIYPSRYELTDFYDEVDALQEATERLEKRLEYLEGQRDGLI